MKMRLGLSQKGFTLPEVITGAALAAILLASLVACVNFLNYAMQEYQSKVALANEARIMMDSMMYRANKINEAERHGLREAQTFTIISSSEIEYVDKNGDLRRVRSNGNTLETRYESEAWQTMRTRRDKKSTESDAIYSTQLTFTQALPTVVQIDLRLGKRIVGRWHYVSLRSKVRARNDV